MSIIRDLTNEVIENYLYDNDEILLLVGARQAGKTTILYQLRDNIKEKKQDCYFLNLEDPDYLSLLRQSPKNLFKIFPVELSRKSFILVDEIQYLDNPSNFLKYFYDEYRGKIKIIASGSSAFYIDEKFKDSLAGRKKIFYVLTLSFREFLRFKNEPILAQKDFHNLALSEREKANFFYQEYIVYGGYPRIVLAAQNEKETLLGDIAYSYIKKDVLEANIRQDEMFYKLFKILSGQTGCLVNAAELASTLGISKSAVDNYLYVMQKSFHLALVRPFFKNLRKELTKMPKVYFLDMGLRNFFLRNFELFALRQDKGSLLENAVYRELLSKNNFEDIRFWRTIQKNEVDFVLGEEAALEVKSDEGGFKKSRYAAFLKSYPKIKLSVVSLGARSKKIDSFDVLEPWEAAE